MIIIVHPLAKYWTTLASLKVASRWERNEESDSTLLPGHYGKSTLPVYFKRLCADTAQQPGSEPLIMLLCALSPRPSIIIYQHRRRYISKTKKKIWIKPNKVEKTKQNKISTGVQLIFCSGQQQLLWLTAWLNGREHNAVTAQEEKLSSFKSHILKEETLPRNGSPGHTSTVAPKGHNACTLPWILRRQFSAAEHMHVHTQKTAWVHAWLQAVRRFYGQHGSRFGKMWHIKEPAATDCMRRSLSSTQARKAASQQKAPRRHNRSTHIDEWLNSRLQSWVKAELWCPRVWDVAPSNGEKAQYSFILFKKSSLLFSDATLDLTRPRPATVCSRQLKFCMFSSSHWVLSRTPGL